MNEPVYYGKLLLRDNNEDDTSGYSRTVEIDDRLYYKIEFLSKKVYNASINKLVIIALDFIMNNHDLIRPYLVNYKVTNFRRTLYLPKGKFLKYKQLADSYNIPFSQLVNMALFYVLEREPEELFNNYKYPYEDA